MPYGLQTKIEVFTSAADKHLVEAITSRSFSIYFYVPKLCLYDESRILPK